MAELSKDYHDYVFRDGKPVGEFEAIYRNSSGITIRCLSSKICGRVLTGASRLA